MKNRMHILLLEIPRLLREILESVFDQQEHCELLNGTSGHLETHSVKTTEPDIVILGLMAADDALLIPGLFARWPNASVMTVLQKGDELELYELRPEVKELGQMSPNQIVAALLEVFERGPSPAVRLWPKSVNVRAD